MKNLKRFGIPLFGFLVGAMFFFPWNDVRDLLSTQIQKNSGVSIQMQSFSPTLGLRIGIGKGSLLAFSAGKSSIRLPAGQMILCDELILGPRFWPLLLAQVQLSIGCKSNDGGQFAALVKASPIWGPTSAGASVDLDNFSLTNVDLHGNMEGVLTGSVDVANIPLANPGMPDITWELNGKKILTPEFISPVAKLPALDLQDIETNGSVSSRTIKVNSLKFGSPQTLMEGKMSFQSDMVDGAPSSGELAGTLRIDPTAENGSLKDSISWKTMFGDGDEKGRRTFKRSFTGGIQSMLLKKYTPGGAE